MVKFGAALEEYELPEWKGHYLRYRDLADQINRLSSSETVVLCRSKLSLVNEWRDSVAEEAHRIGNLVADTCNSVQMHLAELSAITDGLPRAASQDAYLELRVLDSLKRLEPLLQSIHSFTEFNTVALYQLFKKHDKCLGTAEGIQVMLPKLLLDTRLKDTQLLEELGGMIKALALKSAQLHNPDSFAEVVYFTDDLLPSSDRALKERRMKCLYFFVGYLFAGLMTICLLIGLPPVEPDTLHPTFSMAYFMAPFAIFRLGFSIILVLFGVGVVMRVCNKNDINLFWILQMDPRVRITPGFFLLRASMLLSVWLVLFGLYIVDYKFILIAPKGADGYNSRASSHFVAYPIVLLCCICAGFLWPSKYYSGERVNLLKVFGRSAAAPFFPVYFCDNLGGDVLTSLVRPLEEILNSYCYLASEHPLSAEIVRTFEVNNSVCPDPIRWYVFPLIAAFPLVMRMLQCLRRYTEKGERKHLFNCLKYMCSVSVVLVSAFWGKKVLWIVASVVATSYAATWDVLMDWGLGLEMISSCACGQRGDQIIVDAHVNDSLCSPVQNRQNKRMFRRRVYWCFCMADVALRCSWIFTLMPLYMFQTGMGMRNLWEITIAALEIFRRSMWSIIRIEWEQVSNASGFRSLLWVPHRNHRHREVLLGLKSRVPQHSFQLPSSPSALLALKGLALTSPFRSPLVPRLTASP